MSSLFHSKMVTSRFVKMNHLFQKRRDTYFDITRRLHSILATRKANCLKVKQHTKNCNSAFFEHKSILNFVLSGFCLSLFVKNSQILTSTTFLVQKLSQSSKIESPRNQVRPDTKNHLQLLSLQYHFQSFIVYMKGNEKIPEINDGKCDILLPETYIISLDQKY